MELYQKHMPLLITSVCPWVSCVCPTAAATLSNMIQNCVVPTQELIVLMYVILTPSHLPIIASSVQSEKWFIVHKCWAHLWFNHKTTIQFITYNVSIFLLLVKLGLNILYIINTCLPYFPCYCLTQCYNVLQCKNPTNRQNQSQILLYWIFTQRRSSSAKHAFLKNTKWMK